MKNTFVSLISPGTWFSSSTKKWFETAPIRLVSQLFQPLIGCLHRVCRDFWLGKPSGCKLVHKFVTWLWRFLLLECQFCVSAWNQQFEGGRSKLDDQRVTEGNQQSFREVAEDSAATQYSQFDGWARNPGSLRPALTIEFMDDFRLTMYQ